MPRPCPFVSCRHHLRHKRAKSAARRNDAEESERIAEEVASLEHSCSLDLAEFGGMNQMEVAEVLGISHQAVSQLENGPGAAKVEKEMVRLGHDYDGRSRPKAVIEERRPNRVRP